MSFWKRCPIDQEDVDLIIKNFQVIHENIEALTAVLTSQISINANYTIMNETLMRTISMLTKRIEELERKQSS